MSDEQRRAVTPCARPGCGHLGTQHEWIKGHIQKYGSAERTEIITRPCRDCACADYVLPPPVQ